MEPLGLWIGGAQALVWVGCGCGTGVRSAGCVGMGGRVRKDHSGFIPVLSFVARPVVAPGIKLSVAPLCHRWCKLLGPGKAG